MQIFPRMDQQQFDILRRQCKEAAMRILPPGASEAQLSVVTEKIYLNAAGEALGGITAAIVLGNFATSAQSEPKAKVAATLQALNTQRNDALVKR